MRVCCFGAYDPGYPRNRILRDGLARAGVDVVEARVPEHRAFRRYPALIAAYARAGRDADALFVPEFRHKDMPLARVLAGRRRLEFDPLVSRYDTLVGDWGLHAEGSMQARWNLRLDAWALSLADVIVCDTWAHGALYVELGADASRLRRVLVGAEDAFFAIPPAPAGERLEILYVGGFLPLHGVRTIIEAVALLERDRDTLPAFRVTLLGKGIEFDAARALAAERGVQALVLAGPAPYAELPARMAAAHVVLGAFGSTAKAGRVVPHKVYQGLAAGRAVVTGDGRGVREVLTPDRDVVLVPRGDAVALAAGLAGVMRDAPRRDALARAGRARAIEIGTPARLGAELRAILEGGGACMP
jgi:glycosyltransferase involved in cell wall biosynthesis